MSFGRSSSSDEMSLNHAFKNVSAYRRKCELAGGHPDDLKYIDRPATLPLHNKRRSARNYPSACFAVRETKSSDSCGPSGTTGKPTVVG